MTKTNVMTAIAHEIRNIRRDLASGDASVWSTVARLNALEILTAPSDIEDYITPLHIFDTRTGNRADYDTILGFLAKEDPLHLLSLADPIRDTIRDGHVVRDMANKIGVAPIKVPAPRAVTVRYPAVETVNAYPVTLLLRHFHGSEFYPSVMAA